MGRVDGRRLYVLTKKFRIFIRWRSGGDELWTSVEEQFLKGSDAFLAGERKR